MDDLLSLMENDMEPNGVQSQDEYDAEVNNTMYVSALRHQSWTAEDSETDTHDQHDAEETLFKSFEESATRSNTSLTTICEHNGAANVTIKLKDEFSACKKRMNFLHEEIVRRTTARKTVGAGANTPVSVKRSVTTTVKDNPIDFKKPTPKLTLNGMSKVHEHDGSHIVSDDDEETFATPGLSKRLAPKTANADHVAFLRQKAESVSKRIQNDTTNFSSSSSKVKSCTAYYNEFFRIQVVDPKISSSNFQAYVASKKKMRISQFADLKSMDFDDWLTMGVIVEKSAKKKSANGNDYMIWKLCDLLDCKRMIRLFIFGSHCVNHCWKYLPATVVAVLNASFMPGKQENIEVNIPAFKVDNAEKVLELGQCPDFAYCKAYTRADLGKCSKRCTNVVNKSSSDICDYHVMAESKRLATKRGEFQLSSNIPPKFYEKRTFGPPGLVTVSNSTTKSNLKRSYSAAELANRISQNKISQSPSNRISSCPSSSQDNHGDQKNLHTAQEAVSADIVNNDKNVFADLLKIPSAGSLNLLKQILPLSSVNDNSNALGSTKRTAPSVQQRSVTNRLTCREFLNRQVGKNYARKMDIAKAKAVAVLRQRKQQRKNTNPVQKADLAEHSQSTSSNDVFELIIDGCPESKRSKLGDINISKADIKQLLSKTSKHEKKLMEDDLERQEAFFKVMEAKEKVEQRATEIKEIQCKVVTCKQCNYTWHSQSEMCKQFQHKILWHAAPRRFFKCKDCGKRAIAYGKYPARPCANCNSTTFERTTMRPEKKAETIGEKLKIRGDEEPFIG